MVTPAAGTVVLVRFPFSDLSLSKLRPAVVMTSAGRDDFILVQVTSNPYSDPLAVALTEADFSRGSLERASYARPGKLFTANRALIAVEVGSLSKEAFGKIVAAIVEIFEKALRERS